MNLASVSFAVYIVLLVAAVMLATFLWLCFLFRDRTRRPMERVEVIIETTNAVIEFMFIRLVDFVTGTKAEKVSKRKVKELLK
jgi:hypothetical protein